MGLSVTTAPSVDAVDVLGMSRVKEHLRVDGTQDDDLIRSYAQAAFDHIEGVTWRALVTQTLKLTLPRFATPILLPRDPIQSVDSVKYLDLNGDEQTLTVSDDWVAYTDSNPVQVRPAYQKSWPSARFVPDAIRVTFTAGYGTNVRDLPDSIVQAALLIIGDLFEHRESSRDARLNRAVDALLAPYIIRDERVSEYV